MLSEVKIAFRRAQKFIAHVESPQTSTTSSHPRIALVNATFSWRDERAVLSGVTANVHAGEMLAVVGPVGCGEMEK